MLGFSGTASATRVVVVAAGPWVAALGRALVAASVILLVAALRSLVRWARQHRQGAITAPRLAGPAWRAEDRRRLVVVAFAIVTAFPLLHAQATASARASEMALLGGFLPVLTALFGRWRTRERMSLRVWLGAAVGTGALSVFALAHGGPDVGRGFSLGAVAIVAAAFGYAEGALLARRFGAAAVMTRAVLVGVVLDALVVVVLRGLGDARPMSTSALGLGGEIHVGAQVGLVLGLFYLGVVSMWLAYLAWYTGLARLGVSRGALVQLAQVPLGLLWSWCLLGERWGIGHLLTAVAVLMSLRIALGGGAHVHVTRPPRSTQQASLGARLGARLRERLLARGVVRALVARRGWTRP